MVLADGQGIPLGVSVHSASPHEVTLADQPLEQIGDRKPERLICDKAYDSDKLRNQLQMQGIELIVPPRQNKRKKRQDGRALRRYKRRWKIERTIAWLGNYRRLVTRWERNDRMYQAFLHIACALITCNNLCNRF
jgi:transposase